MKGVLDVASGRLFSGVAAGVLVSGAVIGVWEMAAHSVLRRDPLFLAVALGYGVGGLFGSAVAAWLADRGAALTVVIAVAALAAVNLLSFPHPLWFAPVAALFLTSGGWLGARMAAGVTQRRNRDQHEASRK
jgi:FtsH-binding integral membrane protein